MKLFLIRTKLVFLLVHVFLISFNCANFNQTRKIAQKSFGTERLYIRNITRVRKIDQNQIQIIAETTNLEKGSINTFPYQPGDQKCYFLNLDDTKNKNHYNIETAYFTDECDTIFISKLFFRKIAEPEFNSNLKKENFELIQIMINNKYNYYYFQIQLDEKELNQSIKYTIDSSIHKKTNPKYTMLYPIAIPFDIIAGTLHTIGMPFAYASLVLGSLSYEKLPLYRKIPVYIFSGTYFLLSYLDEMR